MKNIQKLTMLAMLIACAQSLFAVGPNKQQIFITNNYGSDVQVHINWIKKSIFDAPFLAWPISLKKDTKNKMVKAPYAKYHAYTIKAYPKNGSLSEMTEMNVENDENLFFVIEKVGKKSKPRIKGYSSQEKYEHEVDRTMPAPSTEVDSEVSVETESDNE